MKAVAYTAGIIGLGLFSFGIWRIYHPAAYIIVGFLLMFIAIPVLRGIK